MPIIYAPSIPLDFDSKYGFKNVAGTRELVKFHLTNLLLTYPGEKISDPSYGVGLRRFLFEPFTQDTFINMENEVRQAIDLHLSYLITKRVSILPETSNNTEGVTLRIQYAITDLNVSDVLEIEVSKGVPAETYGF